MNSTKIYPFFILVFTVLLGLLLGNLLSLLLSNSLNLNPSAIIADADGNCSLTTRNYLRSINLINHFFGFVLASLIAAYILNKKSFLRFLCLQNMPSSTSIVASIVLILVAFPGAQILYKINQGIPLPDFLTDAEAKTEKMLSCILQMPEPSEFFFNFIVIAIIPAIGEELLFRGFIQNKLQQMLHPATAIIVTSILFSAFHFQFEGFLPRFLLGAILGFAFYITSNLWVAILAHLFFNGIQVVAYYFVGEIITDGSAEIPWIWGLLSLILVVLLGSFWKKKQVDES
jgi:uncharacterized protein